MGVYVWTNNEAAGWTWTICRTLPHGADVVLQGCAHHPDVASCLIEGVNIGDALSHAVVSQYDDGTWSWCCRDDDGHVLAHSEDFADAVACGDDLSRARMYGQHALLSPHAELDEAEAAADASLTGAV